MKIKLKKITVRELTAGYRDDNEYGVVGYGGMLDIRPPYQREFIYKEKQRDAVINTVMNEFPLNVMYWAGRPGGGFEVLDGQQRTLSICQYINNDFSFKDRWFHGLESDEVKRMQNYKLMVYQCSGDDSEKLEWFKTINIAGLKLTDQELHNAVYWGSWVTDAKRYFSKTGCAAAGIGGDYLKGSPIRQDYLETALKWISNGEIVDYMGKRRHDADAEALWEYFKLVIVWVEATFTNKRKQYMPGVNWGGLYNQYKDAPLNAEKLEARIINLILDDDVTNKSGVYPYVLTGDETHLNIRAFTKQMKQKVYEKQKGKCKKCGKSFDIEKMEADHIDPWHAGGKTEEENCQILCRPCNRRKSGK